MVRSLIESSPLMFPHYPRSEQIINMILSRLSLAVGTSLLLFGSDAYETDQLAPITVMIPSSWSHFSCESVRIRAVFRTEPLPSSNHS